MSITVNTPILHLTRRDITHGTVNLDTRDIADKSDNNDFPLGVFRYNECDTERMLNYCLDYLGKACTHTAGEDGTHYVKFNTSYADVSHLFKPKFERFSKMIRSVLEMSERGFTTHNYDVEIALCNAIDTYKFNDIYIVDDSGITHPISEFLRSEADRPEGVYRVVAVYYGKQW